MSTVPCQNVRWRALLGAYLASTFFGQACAQSNLRAEHLGRGAPARAPTSTVETKARWVARPDAHFVQWVGTGTEAEWLLLAGRQRLLITAAGKFSAATEWLPRPDYSVSRLAPRLGGGFLFVQDGAHTVLHRARSYVAPLEPVARLELPVSEIVQGVDRFYAILDRSRDIVALDPSGRGATSLGPLPSAPAYGPTAFADEWFGITTVPFREALATFDAGATWHQLGMHLIRRAHAKNGSIELKHAAGTSVLFADGSRLDRATESTPQPTATAEALSGDAEEPMTTDEGIPNAWSLAMYARELGERFSAVVLRGWPIAPDAALLVEAGDLLRVDLRTGEVLERKTGVAPREANCVGSPLFGNGGFVCHTRLHTILLALADEPLEVRATHRFDGPRRVSATSTGGVVVSGSCQYGAARSAPRIWCVLPRGDEPWLLSLARFPVAARVVPLGTGNAAVILPPTQTRRGSVTRVTPSGEATVTRLRPAASGERKLKGPLGDGLWLAGIDETAEGNLAGWVVSGDSLVGFAIHPDGALELGPEKASIADTLIHGRRALALGDHERGWQSTDGGLSWQEVPLPAQDMATPDAVPTGSVARGCSHVGCIAAGWVRFGWDIARDSLDLPVAEEVPVTTLPSAGGARWLLSCDNPRKLLPLRDRPSYARRWTNEDNRTDAASGGRGQEFRKLLHSGFMSVHARIWNPSGGHWKDNARWQLLALSGYEGISGQWTTDVTRSPWQDAQSSSEAFGSERSSGPPTVWHSSFDPDGLGGALLLVSRARTEAYLVEAGRPLRRLPAHRALEGSTLLGAVQAQGTWYFAVSSAARTVQILRVQPNQVEAVLTLHNVAATGETRLVRNEDGSSLGLWVTDAKTRGAATRWFVYPIDLLRSAVATPRIISDDALGRAPRACDSDDAGWVLEGSLPLSPDLDIGTWGTIRPSSVRARVLATAGGLCVQSLMAEAAARLNPKPSASTRGREIISQTIPLITRSPDDPGDRWVFECLH